jgi:chorismate mutase
MEISKPGPPAYEPQPAPSVTLKVDLSQRNVARKLVTAGSSHQQHGAASQTQGAAGITPAECHMLDSFLKRINHHLELAPRMAQARWNDKIPGATHEQEEHTLAQIQLAMPDADPAEQQFVRRFFQSQFNASKMVQKALWKRWETRASDFPNPLNLDTLLLQSEQYMFALLAEVRQVRPLLAGSSHRQYLQLRELELTDPAVGAKVRHELLRVLLNPGLIPVAVSSRKD